MVRLAQILSFVFIGLTGRFAATSAFQPSKPDAALSRQQTSIRLLEAARDNQDTSDLAGPNSRRNLFVKTATAAVALLQLQQPALAAAAPTLESNLYRILRVREATQQEVRLIKSGKFKDVQRANVKLAVKFMVNNYRLNDAIVGASGYLLSTEKRVQAGQVGQSAVQNLVTILEYFDSADVQNIKVGSDAMGGKEDLVLRGLDATRRSIDDFLAFFPSDTLAVVKKQVQEENDLNVKEFDSTLGSIVNLPTP